jgi:hypothetical protein
MVLFNNPRDKGQLMRIASQAFPGSRDRIKSVIAELTPFEPLLIDFTQNCPDKYRLRADPFPEDLKEKNQPFTRVFLP